MQELDLLMQLEAQSLQQQRGWSVDSRPVSKRQQLYKPDAEYGEESLQIL